MSKYSLEDLDALILEIRKATGLTQTEIEKAANYNTGYLSQVKTKGKVPDKLMQTLHYRFKDDLASESNKKALIPTLMEQIAILRAGQELYGAMIIEILAHLRNTSSIALNEEAANVLARRVEKLQEELKFK